MNTQNNTLTTNNNICPGNKYILYSSYLPGKQEFLNNRRKEFRDEYIKAYLPRHKITLPQQ
jgi:hypothetical protein